MSLLMSPPPISIFTSTFFTQIFKFRRCSCKLSFPFPPRHQTRPESLLAGYKLDARWQIIIRNVGIAWKEDVSGLHLGGDPLWFDFHEHNQGEGKAWLQVFMMTPIFFSVAQCLTFIFIRRDSKLVQSMFDLLGELISMVLLHLWCYKMEHFIQG